MHRVGGNEAYSVQLSFKLLLHDNVTSGIVAAHAYLISV